MKDMEKKLKMYLSFPITGRNLKDVKAYARRIKTVWEAKGYDVVTPFDLSTEENKPYSYYMGKDIEKILEVDGIIMCDDWFMSKGCRLENYAAQVYGKIIRIDTHRYLGRKEHGEVNQV